VSCLGNAFYKDMLCIWYFWFMFLSFSKYFSFAAFSDAFLALLLLLLLLYCHASVWWYMKYFVFFAFISIPTSFLSSNVVSLFFFMVFVCFYLVHKHNQHKPETAMFYSVPVSSLSCVFIMVREIEAELKILVIKPLLLWTVSSGKWTRCVFILWTVWICV